MTAPAEPTPGAPAFIQPAPAEQAPKPAPPKTTNPDNQAFDGEFDPERAAKLIENLRRDLTTEKSKRTSAETAAEQSKKELTQQIAKALGIGEEGKPVDPAELTSQIEQAQAEAWRSSVELQVSRVAARLGANADALLDSLSFIDSLDDLVEDNPRSPEFASALEAKVQAALEKNPTYRANGQAPSTPTAPRPDPSQGARGPAPAKRATNLREAIERHYRPAG